MKYYVSIDIGGTSIKYGVLKEDGEILLKDSMDTEAAKGGKALENKVFCIIRDCQAKYPLSGVCISTAGMVDCEKGEVFFFGGTHSGVSGYKVEGRHRKSFFTAVRGGE